LRRFVIGRLVSAIPSLVLLSFVVFALVRVIPGDPISIMLEKNQDPELAQQLREFYGLDQPLLVQYGRWIQGILGGSFGNSIVNGRPVEAELAERLPRSLFLMLGSVAVALVLAIPIGLVAAARRNSWLDYGATALVTVLMSIPAFWLGILYILVFAVELQWLPATGYVSPREDFVGFARHMALPWLTLGGTIAALTTRVLRTSLIEELSSDYQRTAAAKGLHPRVILLRHAFRNAAVPMVTIIGLEMGYLMGGAVVTERVFAYPGMGQLLIGSVFSRDYPVIQAGILVFATLFIVMNIVTDVVVAAIDPRIRRD